MAERRIGGTIARRPADEVLSDLEAAHEVQVAAEREARKVARAQSMAQAALKGKLGGHKESPADSPAQAGAS